MLEVQPPAPVPALALAGRPAERARLRVLRRSWPLDIAQEGPGPRPRRASLRGRTRQRVGLLGARSAPLALRQVVENCPALQVVPLELQLKSVMAVRFDDLGAREGLGLRESLWVSLAWAIRSRGIGDETRRTTSLRSSGDR